MNENYYLIGSFERAVIAMTMIVYVMPLSLNLYCKLYCVITDFVNNFMRIIIDTLNSMVPQYYTNK